MLKITPIAKTAEEGAWANYRGVKLLIARANNPKFKTTFRRLTKPYKKEMENETLDEKTSGDLLAQAFAEAILLDWKDFVINGKEIEYNKENAADLLINDPDCLQFVTDYANDIDNYLTVDEDELKGK